jgi:PAS domain S-box-containing protein
MTLVESLTASLGVHVQEPVLLCEEAGDGRPGVIRYANEAFLRQIGLAGETVVGRVISELLEDAGKASLPSGTGGGAPVTSDLQFCAGPGQGWFAACEFTKLPSGGDGEPGHWLIRLSTSQDGAKGKQGAAAGDNAIEIAAEQEEALLQSRQRLSLHVEKTPLAVIEWDLEFRVTEWNPAAERIFGYSYDEIVGRCALDFMVPPDSRELVANVWRQLIADTGGNRGTNENLTKDGRRITCNWYNTPLVDGDGKVIGVASLAEDVTDRVRAEEALRDSEQRLRDFADASSDWFWEMGSDLRVSYVSPRILEVTGVPSSYFLGKTREEYSDTSHDEALWRKHRKDLKARRPFKDLIYRTQVDVGHGRYFRISGLPMFDGNGDFIGYRGTGSDVTEETLAKAEAEAAQSQLQLAIESISEGFAFYDPEGRLVLCNDKYKELFPEVAHMFVPGESFENIFRTAVEQGLYDLPDDMSMDDFIRMRMQQRAVGGKQVQHLKGDRWIQVSERRTDDGGLVGVWTDISELKQREQEAREARDAAQIANRSKSEFLANMSHELRTPLNAIIGFSEVLKGELFGPLGSAQYAEYVADIFQSGTHLLDIINDILDVSKAEAGKLELHEEQVDLTAVVRSSLRLVKDRAAESSLRLETVLPDNLPSLLADERMVKQILINLLSNAVKFTPAGGTVSVIAEAGDRGLELAVRDTGIGIAPENIDKVLEPFGQVDTAHNRTHQGTGLGLPLVKSLVKLHGGRLKIDSELGKGTTVTAHFEPGRLVSH